MKLLHLFPFFSIAALITACASGDGVIREESAVAGRATLPDREIRVSCRQTYGITHDGHGGRDFPVSYREVHENYHDSRSEWVYQPHVIIPEPPVINKIHR